MAFESTDTQMDGGALMRAVMALSGGMDSTGLLMRLLADGYKVSCLSYNYGQKHSIELERAKANIAYLASNGIEVEHRIADLSSAMGIFHSALTTDGYEVPEGHYEEKQMKQTVVPNRNAIFASILYGYALSVALREDVNVVIALGVHSGDHAIYPDCRPEFIEAFEKMANEGTKFAQGNDKIKIHTPLISLTKAEIILAGTKLNVDYKLTHSCYDPSIDGLSCGECDACILRKEGFAAAGINDPTNYI